MKKCRCHLMDNSCEIHLLGEEMKMKERVAEAITEYDGEVWDNEGIASTAIKSMHEPDPHAVALVADKLKLTATQVAAVWMLLIEEMGK